MIIPRLSIIKPLALANAGALRDGDVLLFVRLFVCLFVSLSPEIFVKKFATWQLLAASGGLSYRLRYTY